MNSFRLCVYTEPQLGFYNFLLCYELSHGHENILLVLLSMGSFLEYLVSMRRLLSCY